MKYQINIMMGNQENHNALYYYLNYKYKKIFPTYMGGGGQRQQGNLEDREW